MLYKQRMTSSTCLFSCELHLVPPSHPEARLSESKLKPCDLSEHLYSASANSIEHDLFPKWIRSGSRENYPSAVE